MKKFALLIALSMLFTTAVYAQDTMIEKEVKKIQRHQFTTNVQDREPADTLTTFDAVPGTNLYYFSELMNMQGMTVKQVWYKNDQVVYELPVLVSGPRWRVYSSMKAEQFKSGDKVKVEIVGDDGKVYATDDVTIP